MTGNNNEPTSPVSPNNACPFLRALVAMGYLSAHMERLATIGTVITATTSLPRSQSKTLKVKFLVFLIGAISNGLHPSRILRNLRSGVEIDNIRGGPLYKHGVSSRILSVAGQINEQELTRLDEFATNRVDPEGNVERGLGIKQLKAMMDANFERSAGSRRWFDRMLMNSEWSILLKVMGKNSADPYLSLVEVHTLFVEKRLPPRIVERLKSLQCG